MGEKHRDMKPTLITDITVLDSYDFARADKSEDDMSIFKMMAQQLSLQLREIKDFVTKTPYIVLKEKDNLLHRMIIYNYKVLQKRKKFAFVGFMGHKKVNTTLEEAIGTIDWELAQAMIESSGLFSYCSQALGDGNWFNTVLFDNHASKNNVTTIEKHRYAAHVLAPKYFAWIRLHNGIITNGLHDEKHMYLESTKYYNFENDTMWFGKRVYEKNNF